ncbi:hypothetical protein H4S07_001668 [Coemansia furcata]|uniref:Uncharacterized protein n=1 Tax=Coemansia furcata TaxID=417177 RepID=A0ACC1LNT2_9FUNG|nr:hypothetical protein H4S07_001668 [Coemansia furcata]
MVAKDVQLDSTLSLDSARRAMLSDFAIISTSLQVLKLWHYERLWFGDGNINMLAAKVTTLLACIPSLARFKCRTSTHVMRSVLNAILIDCDITCTVPHLSKLQLCESYE